MQSVAVKEKSVPRVHFDVNCRQDVVYLSQLGGLSTCLFPNQHMIDTTQLMGARDHLKTTIDLLAAGTHVFPSPYFLIKHANAQGSAGLTCQQVGRQCPFPERDTRCCTSTRNPDANALTHPSWHLSSSTESDFVKRNLETLIMPYGLTLSVVPLSGSDIFRHHLGEIAWSPPPFYSCLLFNIEQDMVFNIELIYADTKVTCLATTPVKSSPA